MNSSIMSLINDIQNNKLNIAKNKEKQNKKNYKKYHIEYLSNSKNVIRNTIKKYKSWEEFIKIQWPWIV